MRFGHFLPCCIQCFICLFWLIERGGSNILKESQLTGAQPHCPALTPEALQQCSAGTDVSKNMPREVPHRANAIQTTALLCPGNSDPFPKPVPLSEACAKASDSSAVGWGPGAAAEHQLSSVIIPGCAMGNSEPHTIRVIK